MIFQCNDLERALRSPELMPDARAHAEQCESCRRELYLWAKISRLAPELHREWQRPELWTRIEAGLRATPRRKVVPVWRWAAAAAAVIAMAVVLMQPSKPARRAVPPTAFLTEDALNEVQKAEEAYAQLIEKLSRVAGASLVESPAPLAGAYREKLVLLDSAIADLKASLESNRYNVYLQNQLASLYREKQKTLQDWFAVAPFPETNS